MICLNCIFFGPLLVDISVAYSELEGGFQHIFRPF